MLIIDTPWNTTNKLDCLKSNDVQIVIRYYNHSNSSRLPEKCLTLPEAQAICDKGMRIVTVFQQGQNSSAYFTELQGYEAGRRAHRYAMNEIMQPKGSGIYFSVDFDASQGEIKSCVIPFFQGVARAFNEVSGGSPWYRVGVYGSGATAQALVKNQLCSLVWISMSTGFKGTKEAISSGNFDLRQTDETKICGIGVDLNVLNPNREDIGAFVVPMEEYTAQADEIFQSTSQMTHVVISRSNLRLREGPGVDYPVIGKLSPGQQVVAEQFNTEWSSIDVEGDGKMDGYAASGYLRQIVI